jgi:lysozyme
MAVSVEQLRALRNTAGGQALLRGIRYAEGTDAPDGYNIMFGGRRFSGNQHPNLVQRTSGYASAAAGAYQFMPDTWREVSGRLGLADFSPENQDIAALAKAVERGVDPNKLATQGLSPDDIYKLAPEWASFPSGPGKGSYYGQPSKSVDKILAASGNGAVRLAPLASPATVQAPPPVGAPAPTPQRMAGARLAGLAPAQSSILADSLQAGMEAVRKPTAPLEGEAEVSDLLGARGAALADAASRAMGLKPNPSLFGQLPGPRPAGPAPTAVAMSNPVAAAPSLSSVPSRGNRWDQGPATVIDHSETGSGYTIPGARDANGRPAVFGRSAANSFAAMMRDSGGIVKPGDIASAQRSESKNAAVGGAIGSMHLSGNAMDIHGASHEWIEKNGARYGWRLNRYGGPKDHGGHFEFQGAG